MFSFIQKIEGMEFVDALKLLAKKAGVQLRQAPSSDGGGRSRLQDICQQAADYWHQLLLSNAGKNALDYLHGRDVTDKTIDEFCVGSSLESWDALLNHLKGKGFSEQEIFLAGLAVRKERGSGFYDRFRGRVIFPINDLHGSPVGFSGRSLGQDENVGAKYINTPQTQLYNKSAIVYNLDKAKTEIRKQDLAILVEGQMDVVSSVQAGVRNVVAVSGTALTAEQVKLIKRFTTTIAIALDADAAGQQAVERSSQMIQATGNSVTIQADHAGRLRAYFDPAAGEEMNVKVIVLPAGKDPDECIRKDPKLWVQAIADARPLMDYYFLQAAKRFTLTTAEGKKQAAKMLLEAISKIGNRVEQTHWVQKLAGLLAVTEEVLWDSLPHPASSAPTTTPQRRIAVTASSMVQQCSENLLGMVLYRPIYARQIFEQIEPEMLAEGEIRQLYNQLRSYYTEKAISDPGEFDYQQFLQRVVQSELSTIAQKLVLQAEESFSDFETAALDQAVGLLITRALRTHLQAARNQLSAEIAQAETAGDQKRTDELMQDYQVIVSQLQSLES